MLIKNYQINPYLIGAFTAKLIPFLLAPKLIFLLGATDYGNFFFYLVKVNFLSILISLGFGQVVFRVKFEKNISTDDFSILFFVMFLFSIGVSFILYLFGIFDIKFLLLLVMRFICSANYNILYADRREWRYLLLLISEQIVLYCTLYFSLLYDFGGDFSFPILLSLIPGVVVGLNFMRVGRIHAKILYDIVKLCISVIPYNISSVLIDYLIRNVLAVSGYFLLTSYTFLQQGSSLFSIYISSYRQKIIPNIYKDWQDSDNVYFSRDILKYIFYIFKLFPVGVLLTYIMIIFYLKSPFDKSILFLISLQILYLILLELNSLVQIAFDFQKKMFIYSICTIISGLGLAIILSHLNSVLMYYMVALILFQCIFLCISLYVFKKSASSSSI